MKGLILAAPRSGSGKTTVTLAILAGLRARGVAVRAAKSGPDYIDPRFHEAACGFASPNLDSWAMPPDLLAGLLHHAAQDADMLLIESAMGLFDGVDGTPGRRGSAADLAARFGLPVLLVLDVSGQSQSAAAVARGFATHDPAVRVAGVILNRVGSERHRAQVSQAMAACGLTVLGSIGRDPALAMPERHLGLVQAGEQDLAPLLDRLRQVDLDLDGIAACAAPIGQAPPPPPALPPPGQRIALAQDVAFSFIYPHVLAGWRQAGAEIVPFSPLADEAPDAGCDCCWLPGGYPELHAATLAEAGNFRRGMAQFAAAHPVHGECGGHMVLGQSLETADGTQHAMLGLLGHSTSFAKRRLHLGYRDARMTGFSPYGPQVRGHEFHYASTIDAGPDDAFAHLHDAAGRDLGPAGARRGHITGSFFHAIAAC